MIFTKCIDLGKIYEQVNWQIIFLLAGMIPLGVAMNNTGADQWISDQLLLVFENQTDTIIIGILFLVPLIIFTIKEGFRKLLSLYFIFFLFQRRNADIGKT